MFNFLTAAGLALCAAAPLIVHAQSANPPTVSALQAKAATPEAYRSAFDDYTPYTDEPTGDWAAINATTGKIGGWRVYAREARQAQPADATVEAGQRSSAPAAPAKP